MDGWEAWNEWEWRGFNDLMQKMEPVDQKYRRGSRNRREKSPIMREKRGTVGIRVDLGVEKLNTTLRLVNL